MSNKQCSRRVAAALLVLPLLGGCSDPLRSGDDRLPLLLPVGAEASAATRRSDAAEIVEAKVEGDRLQLHLLFGGGCAEHDFALIHEGEFRESFPVQTTLTLAHDAHGDMCRALLSRELVFDLTPVKAAYQRLYGAQGPLDLQLREPGPAGRSHTVRFVF
jgi:hypothetical protein